MENSTSIAHHSCIFPRNAISYILAACLHKIIKFAWTEVITITGVIIMVFLVTKPLVFELAHKQTVRVWLHARGLKFALGQKKFEVNGQLTPG